MTDVPFIDPFLDEYFAESEEHLARMRRALLALDAGAPESEAEEVRAIARALHTLKGLSGMVGYAELERVAHAMEDVLRSGAGAVRGESLETLFGGAQLLERCLAVRRLHQAPLDVDAQVAALSGAASSPAGAAPAGALSDRLRAAVASGRMLYEVQFTPAQERARRGITVESVRARLAEAGSILETTPRVLPGGGVAFRFVVATGSAYEPPAEWVSDGIECVPLLLPSAPPPPVPQRALLAAARATPSNVVRVELSRLEDLMRLVGELVIGRARLDDALRSLTFEGSAAAWESLNDVNGSMERQLRDLREAVMRVRLVPIGEAFERLRFAVREVAREQGREVSVQLEGAHTEIDKLLVERMLEPLLHLVRNAVSHGIEPPAERAAAGKPAQGRIVLRAAGAGERILITVEDDGRGIDSARVREHARALGATEADTADSVPLLELLCAPGFSTRESADLASGRGVGMAVVHATVHELGGDMELETTPGVGTAFRIELPLTLMIVDALLVEVAGELLAVPQPALLEVLQIDPAAITSFEKNEVVMYRGGVLPLLRLRAVFGLSGPAVSRPPHVLVIGTASQPIGLLVDRIAGLREIVVRPLADPLVAVPGIAGATELSDGRLVLILDTGALARSARERGTGRVAAALGARATASGED